MRTCLTEASTPLWLLCGAHCLERPGFSLKGTELKHISSFFLFCFLWSQEAKPWKPNRNGNRQTERPFQAPWPIIRMGCGFETEVNTVSQRESWLWRAVKVVQTGLIPEQGWSMKTVDYTCRTVEDMMRRWESDTGDRRTLWCWMIHFCQTQRGQVLLLMLSS